MFIDKDGEPNYVAILALVILAVFLAASAWGCFFTVKSGERAIVFTWGEITSVKQEGLNFKVPFMQDVKKVDIRTKKIEAQGEAASKNMQSVNAALTLNYRLDPDKLKDLYAKVGLDVEKNIIDARIKETFKAICAKYTAEELLTQREQVRNEIYETLKRQLFDYYVIVDANGVMITNFDFSAVIQQRHRREAGGRAEGSDRQEQP